MVLSWPRSLCACRAFGLKLWGVLNYSKKLSPAEGGPEGACFEASSRGVQVAKLGATRVLGSGACQLPFKQQVAQKYNHRPATTAFSKVAHQEGDESGLCALDGPPPNPKP